MALKAIMRNRAGEDLMQLDLPDGTTVYPEVILGENHTYIIRRVMPDKRSAIYFEARVFRFKETAYEARKKGEPDGGSH